MSADVGALRAILSLESAAFTKGLKQAEGGLKRFQAQTAKIGKSLQKVGAVISLAGADIAAGLKSQLNYADDMAKAAQKFAIPIEQLTALKYAADLSGVSLETLGTGLRKLSQNMYDAANGSKSAKKLFADLGVAVTDSAGQLRDTEAVMQDVAGVLAAMPDGAEKTALAMKLFGKSGTEMIPLLNSGKEGLAAMADEARQLGVVIDAKTGKAAEAFNDNLSRLATVSQGIMLQVLAELAPGMVKLSDAAVEMAKGFAQLSEPMREFISYAAAGLVVGGPLVVGLGLAVTAVGQLAGAFSALAGVIIANPIVAIIAAVAAGALLIWYNWDWLKQKMIAIWQAISETVVAAWDTIRTAASDAWTYIKDVVGGAINWITEKWDAFVLRMQDALEIAKKVGDEIRNVWTLGAQDYVREGIKDAEKPKPDWSDDWIPTPGGGSGSSGSTGAYTNGATIGQALADGVANGYAAGMAARAGDIAATADLPAEITRDRLGVQSPSRVFRGIGVNLGEGLGLGIRDGIPGVKSAMDDLGASLGTGTDSLRATADDLRETFKGVFRDGVTGAVTLSDALSRLAAKFSDLLADRAFDGLFGQRGIFGGLFDSLAGILGFAKGGVFAAGGRLQAFANGGVVSGATAFAMRGSIGVMGEAGPEAIMPLTRGPGGRLGVEAPPVAVDVRVSVDENGNLQAYVDGRAQVIAGAYTVSAARQQNRAMPGMIRQMQIRGTK